MSNGIMAATGRNTLLIKSGYTKDIIDVILETIPTVRQQTAAFSRQFSRDEAGLERLWEWVKNNIRYLEDPFGIQWIKEPARLWRDKTGDCKSFTLFIVSVLENMGLPYIVRFASYKNPKKLYTHVYPIAFLPNGQSIIMDAVWDRYDEQKPIFGKKDYKMADIYRLSGIGATSYQSDIPDSIIDADGGDITQMTVGELDRWLTSQRLRAQAIHVNDPATQEQILATARAIETANVSGIGSADMGQFLADYLRRAAQMNQPAFDLPGINGPIDKVKDALQKVIKKILNWIFKDILPKAAPFFLYAFLKKPAKGKTGIRQKKQLAILKWIAKETGTTAPKLLEVIRTALIKQNAGKTPEQLLNASAKASVAGARIGWITAVLAILPFVVKIVQEIVKAKGGKGPEIDEYTAPDEAEFIEDMSQPETVTKGGQPTPTKKPPRGWDDNNNGLLIGGAVIVAAAIFLKK